MKLLKQFLIILAISFVGEILKYLLPLPVPASIYGMVILFIGLLTGLIPLNSVRSAGYISLAVSFIILVVFIVVLLFTYMYGILAMNTTDNIDLVMTTYCKRMETQGCLTASEVDDMKNQLSEYGMVDITVSGQGVNTTAKVPYGDKVSIVVKCDLDYFNSAKMTDIKGTLLFFREFLNDNNFGTFRNRTMIKSGTSKC